MDIEIKGWDKKNELLWTAKLSHGEGGLATFSFTGPSELLGNNIDQLPGLYRSMVNLSPRQGDNANPAL